MDIRLVQNASLPVAPKATRPAAAGSDAPLPKPAAKAQDIPTPVQQDQTSDEARRALVQKAAQKMKDVYVVSDVKFTIFKDSSGQYITRFTNLRDGKVSYIPEYDMLSQMSSDATARMLDIDV